MKVFAVNSSPRSSKESYTAMMLNWLTQGMKEARAQVEVIQLREKEIRSCIGCFTCWTKTPGRCVHNDDMSLELYPKWLASDLVIYATPLYFHTRNAALSVFMERTLPVLLPFIAQDENGKSYHPLRHKIPPQVFLSVCGFPDASEFDAFKDFIARTRHKDSKIAAVVCRAGASLLSTPFSQRKSRDILDATRQAGRELVTAGQISEETMARITQPLGDTELFDRMANIYWKTCIAEGVTPKQFEERRIIPRPENIDDFILMFPFGLNPRAAGNRQIFLQFIFSGPVEDRCYFTITDGKVTPAAGVCENPDLTIETPFDVWMDIMTGKADGAKMLMEQKYKARGDIALMMNLFNRVEK